MALGERAVRRARLALLGRAVVDEFELRRLGVAARGRGHDGALGFAAVHAEMRHDRRSGLLAAAVREETVMMDIESGRYYGLDDIGSEIWRRLESPCTFGALVDGLVIDFDAERAVIAEDVRKLLSIKAEHKVVTLG